VAPFAYAPETWVAYAKLLIDTKHWEELHPLALQIRKQEGVRDRLAGYTYYLEGRANFAQNNLAGAEAAFQKAGKFPFESPALGLATATSLNQMQFPAVAAEILGGLEKSLAHSTEYWNQVFTAAYKLKDAELMLKAAGKGFELQPQNLVYINNYAAALLVNRQRADETIQLTLQLVAASPNSTIARINHAMALIMNHRIDEAVSQIRGINVRQLTQQEASAFHLASFQIYLEQREFAKAWEARDRIDPRFLFPPQVKWIEQAQQQMPARTVAKI
jgi:predicted Zn-dependent protease